MLALALSPTTNTRSKSTCSFSQISALLRLDCDVTHSTTAQNLHVRLVKSLRYRNWIVMSPIPPPPKRHRTTPEEDALAQGGIQQRE